MNFDQQALMKQQVGNVHVLKNSQTHTRAKSVRNPHTARHISEVHDSDSDSCVLLRYVVPPTQMKDMVHPTLLKLRLSKLT